MANLCACGCGRSTTVARRGTRKGQPNRFIAGHTTLTNRPLADRLWEKVEKTEGCWLFQGSLDKEGYGVLRVSRRKVVAAHRAAWEVTYGPIPAGKDILHHCDVRNCARPDHFFLGDQIANNLDMVAKGRQRGVAGENHPQSRLTAAQVSEIRAAHTPRGPRDGSTLRKRQALAEKFGISVAHVIAIQLGTSWRHLTESAA